MTIPTSNSKIPIPLYIPNILGYIRILLSFIALWKSLSINNNNDNNNPMEPIALWILSSLLDMIDGILARAFNQCSSFGIFVRTVLNHFLLKQHSKPMLIINAKKNVS